MSETLSLNELGIEEDPGTCWHPKAEKFCKDGTLPDLTDAEVEEHLAKPEAENAEGLLEAESSQETPEGVV